MDVQEPDIAGTYSYADYLTWGWEQRVELILGKIFKMSPAPGRDHQQILGNLHVPIWNYFRGKPCQTFLAPFDVRIPGPSRKVEDRDIMTVVQPDLCVICDPTKLDERGCAGAPDWVIEILSKQTSTRDLTTKFEIYETVGVKEYWVVDPEKKSLVTYWLDESGKYTRSAGSFEWTDTVSPRLFPDLQIDLRIVFEA